MKGYFVDRDNKKAFYTEKIKKAIGFNQGQYGDLCMNLVACRAFKRDFPKSKLVFGINKKFEDLKNIFLYNPLIDDIHIWDAYDNWPSDQDKKYVVDKDFDFVFNPMPPHTTDLWYLKHHQTEEVCLMHGLNPPNDLKINLNRYFQIENNKKFIALNLFAETRGREKTPNPQRALKISNFLQNKGYKVFQIGLENQPQISEHRFVGSFFDTVKFVLSCDLLVTVDSAIAWIVSGYSFPTVGLYCNTYYPLAETSVNWRPINPNAVYIEEQKVDDIKLESIEEAIKLINN
jgi:ADP-heptose:LPS heptosyltransferase